MAKRNSDIASLRSEAKRLERSVSGKISRNRRKGIELAGTHHDPRRGKERVSGYNARQMRVYINSMKTFMDRNTQFHAGREGKIVTRKTLRLYEYERKRAEAAHVRHVAAFGDIDLPRGFTVKQWNAINSAMKGSASVNNPYRRLALNIGSEAMAAKSIKKFQRMAHPDYFISEARAVRAQMYKAMDKHGDWPNPELYRVLQTLNDKQFAILVNYTDFADNIFFNYDTLDSGGQVDSWIDGVYEENESKTFGLVEWAASLNI